MTGYKEFEFDLPEALLSSLVNVFSGMAGAKLAQDNLVGIPDAQGVYQLFLNDEIVYIGKTDGEAGLRQRLSRHCYTVLHRKNLITDEVTFKAIRVFVFTAIDLETQLIRHYSKPKVAWNNSGFGSNDPGRNRDDTALNSQSFDALYPIDIDCQLPRPGDRCTAPAARGSTVLLTPCDQVAGDAGGQALDQRFGALADEPEVQVGINAANG